MDVVVAAMEAEAMEAASMEGAETIISSSGKEVTGVVCDSRGAQKNKAKDNSNANISCYVSALNHDYINNMYNCLPTDNNDGYHSCYQ